MKREQGHSERDGKRRSNLHYEQPQGDMENSRAHHGQSESKQSRSGKSRQSHSGHAGRSVANAGTNYQNGDFDRNRSQAQRQRSDKMGTDSPDASLPNDETKSST